MIQLLTLGIDTSTLVCAAGLVEGDELLAEINVRADQRHSQLLAGMIDQVLSSVGRRPADLSCIAVSVGPGSYTGLRIGVSTGKALAWTLGLPLAAVSSLDVVALNAAWFNGPICTMINARRNRVYAAVYGPVGAELPSGGALEPADRPVSAVSGLLDRKEHDDDIYELEDLVALAKRWGEPVMLAGEGSLVYQDTIRSKGGEMFHFAGSEGAFPRGSNVARLGLEELMAGRAADPLVATPKYFRSWSPAGTGVEDGKQ